MDNRFSPTAQELAYLRLLAKQYPNIAVASTEIINLQAILHLPKGTEHFVSDVHGEYEAFSHVLRNASGVVKDHIERVFGNGLRDSEKKSLATLIYYPEQKLELIHKTEKDMDDWYKITLHRLIAICKIISSKYTRSKVRKALPPDFSYVLEELIHEDNNRENKELYYNAIIDSVIKLNQADRFIAAIAHVIQRLAIDRLHVIGDIYDRGPKAAKIMDLLCAYHSVDVQWGNHDIGWVGAAAGCRALICNVIRQQAAYGNLDTLEEDYGINLIPLATFAMEAYGDDPCTAFVPKNYENLTVSDQDRLLAAKMHKAITVLQFKTEAQIIRRHPEFAMDDRLLLDKIDFTTGEIVLQGKHYPLTDTAFPTVDPADPYTLTEAEQTVIDKIRSSFVHCAKLREHVRFLFRNGSIYRISNANLLYHGCIPMNEDGSLREVDFRGKRLSGRAYLDAIEQAVREGYYSPAHSQTKRECLDLIWYLWCGENSPLFGKDRMATFEKYFIADASLSVEKKNPYYALRDKEYVCRRILADFGLDPEVAHIVNGHVPVKVSEGESPIKANGKLFVIDGGFAKAYQKQTGIAGYTLIYNSHGMVLVSHEPFESAEQAVYEEKDIHSLTVTRRYSATRILVKDTDDGRRLEAFIGELEQLVAAYVNGLIAEISV